jgi:hypothetical protein
MVVERPLPRVLGDDRENMVKNLSGTLEVIKVPLIHLIGTEEESLSRKQTNLCCYILTIYTDRDRENRLASISQLHQLLTRYI